MREKRQKSTPDQVILGKRTGFGGTGASEPGWRIVSFILIQYCASKRFKRERNYRDKKTTTSHRGYFHFYSKLGIPPALERSFLRLDTTFLNFSYDKTPKKTKNSMDMMFGAPSASRQPSMD